MAKFHLNPEWAGESKESVIFSAVVATFNASHQPFKLKHVNAEQQHLYVEAIKRRYVIMNPFQDPKVKWLIDYTNFDDDGWDAFNLGDIENCLEDWGITTIEEGNIWPIFNFFIGNYRHNMGIVYITHAYQHELLTRDSLFKSAFELFEEMSNYPTDLKMYRHELSDCPDGWDEKLFGPWPKSGCVLYGMKVPSLNRSNTAE